MAASKGQRATRAAADDLEQAFTDDPKGWWARWRMELDAAARHREKFDREGAETIKRFLDRRDGPDKDQVRINIYASNVQTQECMLFGKTPSVDVARRFSDHMDAEARVASSMLDRLLNTDVGQGSDSYAATIEYALSDYLRPGLGVARARYEADFETTEGQEAQLDEAGQELAPAVEAMDRKTAERVCFDYTHWRDYRWSAEARTWHDVRWQGFRSWLSREEFGEKFGEDALKGMTFSKGSKGTEGGSTDSTPGETDARKSDPWGRAEVWEIWDKEHKCLWFWVRGARRMLTPAGVDANPNGSVTDPLGLDDFWPNPRPMMANLTTDALLPRSDYAIVQDLYREVDDLSTRISRLTRAMRVAGVYDKANSGIQRLVRETTEGELIAVDNWAKFVEKGGVKGAVDWLPLDLIAGALDKLRDLRREAKQYADEISGFSDMMRGEQQAGTTATTSAIEAKFASVRMQRRQDEVARFASDLKRIEAEIVCKHFDDETIIKRSNVLRTPDAKLAAQALQVLRDDLVEYRIEVKPEAIALTDWGLKKAERSAVIQTLGGYFQSTMPFIQLAAGAGPGATQIAVQFVFQTAQWLMAGIRGGSDIESTFNDFISKAEQLALKAQQQPPQPPPPDPKVMAAGIKAKAEMGKAQLGLVQAKVDAQTHAQKAGLDLQVAQASHNMEMQKLEAEQRREAVRAVSQVIPGAPGATP